MKSNNTLHSRCRKMSLPVRGAWVEILHFRMRRAFALCRSPCGERGLKCDWERGAENPERGRSPCGERGLK